MIIVVFFREEITTARVEEGLMVELFELKEMIVLGEQYMFQILITL